MKWYIWTIIIVVVVGVAFFFAFGRKRSVREPASELPTGDPNNPITNAGSQTGNQHPSAFDWIVGVVVPLVDNGIAVLPSLLGHGGSDTGTG